VIVGGKGGVGRSTVAAALGLAAAREGRRTLVAELDGRSDVVRLLGGESGDGLEEVELRPNLYHVSIDRRATLRDYLDHEVPGPLPAGRLTRSRTFSLFIDATPGMGELLSLGKVWELAEKRRRRPRARSYDLVVLDGPASGQLLALLRAPGTFGAMARMGPVARQTKAISRTLTDRAHTGVLLVSTPEQMAVSETLTLHSELDRGGLAVIGTVVNRTVTSPFTRQQEKLLATVTPDEPALTSARWFCDRVSAQRRQLSRLSRDLPGVAQTRLPLLFGEFEKAGIEELAGRLAQDAP
jgi:anion-transporting  ArsA/GET3 family ATPase